MRKRKMPKITEFYPKHPEKYFGTSPILSRSSWELYFMDKLDQHPHVVKWASESLPINYTSPKDGKRHRYFPDFVVEFKHKDGSVLKQVIELKPMKECLPGTHKNPKKRAYQDMVYLVNQAKWEATKALCEQNDFEFKVYTERELFGK
jgi:hypothetical protein